VNAVAKFLSGRFSDSSQGELQIVTCPISLENGQVFLNTERHLDIASLPPLLTVGLRQENRTVMVSFFATENQTFARTGGKPLPATLQKLLRPPSSIREEDVLPEKAIASKCNFLANNCESQPRIAAGKQNLINWDFLLSGRQSTSDLSRFKIYFSIARQRRTVALEAEY
jgi:hypothetical protein